MVDLLISGKDEEELTAWVDWEQRRLTECLASRTRGDVRENGILRGDGAKAVVELVFLCCVLLQDVNRCDGRRRREDVVERLVTDHDVERGGSGRRPKRHVLRAVTLAIADRCGQSDGPKDMTFRPPAITP